MNRVAELRHYSELELLSCGRKSNRKMKYFQSACICRCVGEPLPLQNTVENAGVAVGELASLDARLSLIHEKARGSTMEISEKNILKYSCFDCATAYNSIMSHQKSESNACPRSRKSRKGLSSLIESTNIPAELVRAVVRQMGGWNSFSESAPDITRHGIDGGFSGFIYNCDTESFARRNRTAIATMAEDQASDFGTSATEMIQGFGCFRNDKPTESEIGLALYVGKNKDDGANVLNALAWYAGEEVARAYCDAFDPQ